MEVKINREIRNYTESMFFGLSMRQFIFSVLACGVAVGLYFILRPYFGVETLSWMCILGAAPFAMLGFITYHGMTAEQFIWAWLRSEMLEPKELKFEDSNYYYAALKGTISMVTRWPRCKISPVLDCPTVLATLAGIIWLNTTCKRQEKALLKPRCCLQVKS